MNQLARQILDELQIKLDNKASALELLVFIAEHHLFSIESTLLMINNHKIDPVRAINTSKQFWQIVRDEILMINIIENMETGTQNPENN